MSLSATTGATAIGAMTAVSSIVLQATGATGIDTATFIVVVTAMAGTISSLAVFIWKTERDRRIAAEEKLQKYEELAPDAATYLRRMANEERRERRSLERPRRQGDLPFPIGPSPSSQRSSHRRRP